MKASVSYISQKKGLDSIPSGFIQIDLSGQIIHANKVACDLLEVQESQLIGACYNTLPWYSVNEDDPPLKENEYTFCQALKGETQATIVREVHLNGKLKWFLVNTVPYYDDGNLNGAISTFVEITDKKKSEKRLEINSERYEMLLKNTNSVVWESEVDSLTFSYISPKVEELFGYPQKCWSEEGFLQSKIHPEDQKWVVDCKKKNSRSYKIEYRLINKDKEVRWVNDNAECVKKIGTPIKLRGLITDVTDEKVAKEELHASQKKLLESQRILKMGYYELDLGSGEFIPSSEMSVIMGFDKNDQHISVFDQLVHPDDLQEFQKKFRTSVASADNYFHTYRIYHLKTKKIKWILGRGKIVRNERGKAIKLISTVQDISEQWMAENKIRKLTDRIILATEIAHLGIWEYDRDADQVIWEDQMYEIFTTFDKPVGIREISKLLVEEDLDTVEENLKLVRKGVNFIESEFRIKINNEVKYLRSFTRVLRYADRRIKGIVGVVYDVTKDKRLQEELKNLLDEKNLLMKEVHHRVKNNLQLISSIMALKSCEIKENGSWSVFEDVNNRIKAMSVIHDNLYTFHNVSEINVGDYLRDIVREFQVLIGVSSVRIEVEVGRLVMNVDRVLLIGLLMNELVSNAIKHGYKDSKEGTITIYFSYHNKVGTLCVINDGDKIPEDVLSRETGLGMSLIKTFVKQLQGKIEVDSRNGFRINMMGL